jgi:hypothetical protein
LVGFPVGFVIDLNYLDYFVVVDLDVPVDLAMIDEIVVNYLVGFAMTVVTGLNFLVDFAMIVEVGLNC